MQLSVEGGVARAGRRAEQAGRRAARSRWTERLARAGSAAKGVVYAIIGVLALQAAFGRGGKTTDTRGALGTIAAQPFGAGLLVLMAVGLAGYAFWRAVEAAADPDHKGRGPKGLAVRAGYLGSAAIHVGLAAAAVRLVLGSSAGRSSDASARGWTAWLLQLPFGQWLVAAVGAGFAAAGIAQIVKAVKRRSLERKLGAASMDPRRRQWVLGVSRAGVAARGAVFVLIGLFFALAGLHANPREAKGLDGALAALARQPYGMALLAAAAAGLVAYAVYMGVQARYRRFAAR